MFFFLSSLLFVCCVFLFLIHITAPSAINQVPSSEEFRLIKLQITANLKSGNAGLRQTEVKNLTGFLQRLGRCVFLNAKQKTIRGMLLLLLLLFVYDCCGGDETIKKQKETEEITFLHHTHTHNICTGRQKKPTEIQEEDRRILVATEQHIRDSKQFLCWLSDFCVAAMYPGARMFLFAVLSCVVRLTITPTKTRKVQPSNGRCQL